MKMRSMLAAVTGLGIVTATVVIAPSQAAEPSLTLSPTTNTPPIAAPPKDKITAKVVSVNGSGCPEGSAQVTVSPDNTSFTVTYSEYTAQAGGDAKTVKPTDLRKNCQLGLKVDVPQGFTYAIASADYRGFAKLSPGVTGTERANYYFQGMPNTLPAEHSIKGAYSDDWQFTDNLSITALVLPCGEQRNFNINTELRVNLGSSNSATTSFMSMDSTDGNFETLYRFSWIKCQTK